MHSLHIFLASKSPRRSMLLEAAGFQVTVLEIDCDERYPDHLEQGTISTYLAELKMSAALRRYPNHKPLMTADTIVVVDGDILEKPKDSTEATRMLERLSGRQHKVFTGVCIAKSAEIKTSFCSESVVHMADLSPQEIDYYIDTFDPFDKAGSYGIQDWIGWTKISKIEGSYANIMGLPIDQIYNEFTQSVDE